jgi:hypothetical protein
MILSRCCMNSSGRRIDWKNTSWTRRIGVATSSATSMLATRRMVQRRPPHYYPTPPRRNYTTLAIRRLRCENETVYCFDCWNTTAAAVSKGQTTRRYFVTDNSHHQLLHFGRVHYTDSQMNRTKQIIKHGKGNDWQQILELFINEREDYGPSNFATTLSLLGHRS